MKPRTILVLGYLVFLLYAYPGYMGESAGAMLVEARYEGISDGYAPLMVELWRFVNIPLSGPLGMLLLQSGLALFGCYVLLGRGRTAAIASIAILLFPPVMAAMAVIGPDAQLAGFLLGAAALFTYADRRAQLGGLVLAMLACDMRDGAWLATIPVVVFGFVWRAGQRPLVRYAIAVNAAVLVWLLAMAADSALVERVTHRKAAQLAMTDIATMIARSHDLKDSEVRALVPNVHFVAGPEIQARARRARGKLSELVTGPGRLFDVPKTIEEADALIDARAELRSRDFGAYLGARLALWKQLLLHPSNPVYTKDNISGHARIVTVHTARPSAIQRLLIGLVRLFGKTPLFAPIGYLVIALALLPLARGRARMLLASGALLMFATALVASNTDYQHATWPILATIVGATLVVLQRRELSASRR
jgi:hypothetical protein